MTSNSKLIFNYKNIQNPIFIWFFHRRSKKLKISGSKTHQNDLDDASLVSYFELVCEDQLLTENNDKTRFFFIELLLFCISFQFRYATTWDIILMCTGAACTFIRALGMPGFFVVYGEFTTLLVDRTLGYGTSSTTNILPLFGGGKIL